MIKKLTLTIVMVGLCLTSISAQSKMETKVHEIQEVVVTGTGTQHLLKNAPVQTEVISKKMLEAYGGKSIEDILSGLTASFSFNEGDMGSQMQLNGLGNNYILVLIDGKRIHGDNGGENDLGLINPHNIERIEIVKGAQSALYGSDAIAGVINIITKKHQTKGILVENSTRYGSHNDLRQHNSIGFRLGKVQLVTNFQLQHSDGWQNTSEEYAEAKLLTDSRNMTTNRYTNWQVAERLDYSPMKGLDLYAEGSFYRKGIYRPQNGLHPSCDVYTYDLRYRNAGASIGGKWMLNSNNKTTKQQNDYLQLDIDWNKHEYSYLYTAETLEDGIYNGQYTHYYPYFPGQTNMQSDQHRVLATLKGVFYLPYKNTLNVGSEYRYDYLNAPMRVSNGIAKDWTAAVYAQDEFDMVKNLNITAGLRLIQNRSFGFHATPKVCAMLSLGDFRLRGGWSMGFKSPTPKELGYHYQKAMGAKLYYYMGNEDLKPQTSNYASVGLEYRTSKFSASVTGYYNVLMDMITLVNVPVSEIPKDATSEFGGDGSGDITPRKYMNAEDAKTYGIDVNMSWNITKEIIVGGNYSYLDTKANVYDMEKDIYKDVIIDGMAHNKWNAFATWNHTFLPIYKLGVSLSTRGSSKRYYENDGDGKAFQIWRLGTTHDIGHSKTMTYRVEAGVDNILNFIDKTPRPYHLGTKTSGRTFYTTFIVKFNSSKSLIKNQKLKNREQNEED